MAGNRKKPAVKKKSAPAAEQASARRLKEQRYRSFRRSKPIRHTGAPIAGSFSLLAAAMRLLRTNWKVLAGIAAVYGLLNLLLVRNLGSSLDIAQLKEIFRESELDTISSGLTIFTLLVGTVTDASDPATDVYQGVLMIIASLAIIWAIRQLQAGSRIGIRDSFYKGMYPMVPFVLILAVIGLQLLPAVAGSGLFATAMSAESVVTGAEKALLGTFFALLAVLSLYMVCSSSFALLIVTLPDMTPLKALRSARQLVKYRRLRVLRRLLFLPLAILVIGVLVMLPLIIFVAPLAEPVFLVYSALSLALVYSYLYLLYRELL